MCVCVHACVSIYLMEDRSTNSIVKSYAIHKRCLCSCTILSFFLSFSNLSRLYKWCLIIYVACTIAWHGYSVFVTYEIIIPYVVASNYMWMWFSSYTVLCVFYRAKTHNIFKRSLNGSFLLRIFNSNSIRDYSSILLETYKLLFYFSSLLEIYS